MRSRATFAAAACAYTLAQFCVRTAYARPDATFVAVNWSLVDRSAIAAAQKALVAPIGCTCVQTSGSECPFFDCPCTCDLTAGACDAFCCCDVECSTDYVESVKDHGLCVDSDPIRPSIEYCSMDLTLKSVASSHVNPLLVDSVLCVAVDNNEVVGDYIAAPDEQSMAVASAFLQNPKQYAFTTSDPVVAVSDAGSRSTYQPGDLIPTFASTSTASVPGPMLMGWSTTAGSTRCSRQNPVRFGFDWPTSSCVVDELDLEHACEAPGGVLDPSAIAANLLVAVNPSVASAASGSKSTVTVDVEALREIDAITGELVELETPFPAYYPEPQLAINSKNISSCSGALVSVAYTVYHNGSGLVESVGATITIGTLVAPSNSSVSITQSFSVRFVSTANVTRSLERGNLISYDRSGNPGYVLHKPVRVGVVEESLKSAQVVSEMRGGLSLRGLRDCDDGSLEIPTLFGEDSQLSCTLTLNASAFKSFCERDEPIVADALRVGFTHVARFGNSDPFLIDEWLAIDYDAPSKTTTSFADASGTGTVELTCNNVISTLHIEFLVATVGSVNNPQNKIVAARATHGKEDAWTFWKNPRDAAKEETYLLTTTVSFVQVQTTTLDQWIPPTPPIWFSIPNDVFYPFILNDGVATTASTWTVVLWVSCAALWSLVA